MLSRSIVAALAACMLLLGSAATAPAKPAHHGKPAAHAMRAFPMVLPADMPMLNAGAASQPSPLSPTMGACVTLTNTNWINGTSAKLCGVESGYNKNVTVYPGIRYATAVRWQGPVVNLLSSVNLPSSFGSACPQTPTTNIPESSMSEDCLFLNVWTPPASITPPAGGFPVMVFIHGGAFMSGAGSLPTFDGTAFAANNHVILVTLNYRLGPLGFLYTSTLYPTDYGITATGNFGILDQQMAMKWVAQNISAFNGNPGHITLFGESAGAMSVGLHLHSIPGSSGYFRAAIMESNPVGLLYHDVLAGGVGPAATISNQFLYTLCTKLPLFHSCKNGVLGDAQTTTTNMVINAMKSFPGLGQADTDYVDGYISMRALPWQPVIDHSLIVSQPYQGYATGIAAKPVLFGVNQDEGVVFGALIASIFSEIRFSTPGASPDPTDYQNTINLSFGSYTVAPAIAAANSRYNGAAANDPPNYQPGANYYSSYGQAAANAVTDYDFAAGNIVMANQSSAAAVYAYYFDEAPLWDFYGTTDNNACGPKTSGGGGYVCHGAELPYVFNSLPNVAPVAPSQAELDLATAMNAAWAAFATSPGAPGYPFLGQYSGDPTGLVGGAVTLDDKNISILPDPPAPKTQSIDPNHVFGIWAGYYPLPPPTGTRH